MHSLRGCLAERIRLGPSCRPRSEHGLRGHMDHFHFISRIQSQGFRVLHRGRQTANFALPNTRAVRQELKNVERWFHKPAGVLGDPDDIMLESQRLLQIVISSDITMKNRTALLIRCSRGEADLVRRAAHYEYRTMSAYVLNVLLRALRFEDRLFSKMAHADTMNRVLARTPVRPPGPRTAILLRCSTIQAEDIRLAAKRREIPISSFVMHSLQRYWAVTKDHPEP